MAVGGPVSVKSVFMPGPTLPMDCNQIYQDTFKIRFNHVELEQTERFNATDRCEAILLESELKRPLFDFLMEARSLG